jgi:hypothetical protein
MSDPRKLLLAAALIGPCALAGTIIDTNLPANDIIVNINAQADGAALYNGVNQNLWYQPFNIGGSLLEVTLQPGTYSFRVIDQTDAASMFPSLTSGQVNEIGVGGWTFNSPWSTDYIVFDSSAATNKPTRVLPPPTARRSQAATTIKSSSTEVVTQVP